ncbi:MAG: NUDIX domain-containing protein [Pseudomonadota bacterium]
MARVFLTAPFDAPDFTDIVCPQVAVTPGTLAGYRQGIRSDGVPWICPDAQSAAKGVFVELNQSALANLTHVTQVLGAPWRKVTENGAPVLIFASERSEEQAGNVDHTRGALSAMLGEAAIEILGYRGRLSMPEIATRRQMILARAWARVAAQGAAPTDRRSARPAHDVRVTDMEATHEGYFLTRRYHLRHPVFAGGLSAEVAREVFVATDAALVLPYDPVTDRLLLVEQFRMGPFGRGDPKPWVLEPVAGRVDAGETPEACAVRECQEEAHLDLSGLEHISSHYCSPGCSTEVFHCYVGLCDLANRGDGKGGLADEHEDIATHILSFDDAMTLTRTGEINIGPLLLMLLWLERERPRLRAVA